VVFGADSGKSTIYHEIQNFVPGSPNTQLRVVRNGDVVFYANEADGLNGDLLAGGVAGVYEIQSLAGGVGYLKPLILTLPGTIIMLK
jgi:hypothetical protein